MSLSILSAAVLVVGGVGLVFAAIIRIDFCVSFVLLLGSKFSLESLILAQDERWRRA